ncbi:hypothetical protein JWS13_05105 (plasmid) [Rhodococcus pseudokoreensis]|uniref:Uncharacterized protein n=1 Tax=Rhodococcus pseudokoreensis TaxID=2811421 RepID=A0A974W068_9NOCA|nr:hypothetical protein [Rhodococcus pseudokoreensis]QSE88038.1 hypothetical protein JWS13_05105 [Rhodococcus pseudokoreensis]
MHSCDDEPTDDDHDLLDLEEPVIDDGIPQTIEDFFRDSRAGADPHEPFQVVAGSGFRPREESTLDDLKTSSISARPETEHKRVPSEFSQVQAIPGALQLIDYDPGLVRAILTLDAPTQRHLAHWCATQAYEFSGLASKEWVVPALVAMRNGRPLPAPFDDMQSAIQRWIADRTEDDEPQGDPHYSLATRRNPFDNGGFNVPYQAIPALFSALDRDPVAAALRTLSYASHTYGASVDDLHRALKQSFVP